VSVTEVKEALGTWSLNLRPETPREILDAITASPFGHIAIVPGQVDPVGAGDGLLSAARYVGVYRGRAAKNEGHTLNGAGMAFWLGDEDGKGAVLVSAVNSASASFATAVTSVIPTDRLTVGTLYSIPGSGTWTDSAQYKSAREALSYITDSYSTDTYPVSWRVNGNGTVDAGRDVDLWPSTASPSALLVRTGGGRELAVTGLDGALELDQDVEDYTTQVVLLAEGEGTSTVTATASTASPYKNLKGNPVVITRLVSEYETSAGNASARAQLQLNRFTSPRKAVSLSTDDFDVRGTFGVGDTIMVYDPDTGFVDTNREVAWKGQPINPAALPVTELTWPIPAGWTVAFRTGLGVWIDLSRYYLAEQGSTTVVVGGISRSLANSGSQDVGLRPNLPDSAGSTPNTTIPNTPAFTSFSSSTYQSPSGNGETRGQVQLVWSLPTNTDASTITDGALYTIRWRPNVSAPYPATWTQANGYTWNAVAAASGKWQQPLISPILSTAWMQTVVPWGTNQILVQELTPGVTYEFQIMAADTASPANQSPFSASTAISVAIDFFPPVTPAAPEVAGNTLAIQVTHRLGRSSGGTYNLDADLHHLEVHVGGDASFFPDSTTKVGDLAANVGLMRGTIPAVGTFKIENLGAVWVKVVAVDITGNKSDPSAAAQVSALLITDQYISNLTATKITAGTMSAQVVVSGAFRTATTGQRAVMNANGFSTYNAAGVNTFWASNTGYVQMVGQLSSDVAGKRVVINPGGAGAPEIRFYPEATSDYAAIYAPGTEISGDSEAWIVIRSSYNVNGIAAQANLLPGYMRIGVMNSGGGLAGGGFYSDTSQYIDGWFNATTGTMTGGSQAYDGYFDCGTYDSSRNQLRGLYAWTSGVALGEFDTTGAQKSGYHIDPASDVNTFYGKFLNNNSFAPLPTEALVTGALAYNAASCAVVYGSTMATTPWAVGTVVCGGGSPGEWYFSATTTTGMTVLQVTGRSSRINYWAFRL
jgi:hypothetical protein